MRAHRQAAVDGPGPVLEHRGALGGDAGLEVGLGLLVAQRLAIEERGLLVEHAPVSGDAHVVRDGVGQPEEVVRDAGADAASRGRMPPVLDVALRELSRGGTDEMRARDVAGGHGQRHPVLELVPEAIGSPRLVEAGSAPRTGTRAPGREASD